jgi:DNA transformation protein
MAEPRGDKLFVNLGASQTRRRLKGFGHGVRKVQTAGRGQAVIIHTAQGKNLRELQLKFADVGYASHESDLGRPLGDLKNVGPSSVAVLHEAGLHTVADLERVGPVAAFRAVRRLHPDADLNLLWSLAAALRDLNRDELSDEIRDRLRRELDAGAVN